MFVIKHNSLSSSTSKFKIYSLKHTHSIVSMFECIYHTHGACIAMQYRVHMLITCCCIVGTALLNEVKGRNDTPCMILRMYCQLYYLLVQGKDY